VGLGLGFPEIARTILREQSFRLENREEKTKVPVPVPENENGKIMVINPYERTSVYFRNLLNGGKK
jgi:hypothetical protein